MDEQIQGRLFEEDRGETSPPEPGLYLGTSGWSYADWDGSLYPPGTPQGRRLPEYADHYASVEIDSTFYGTPRASTVERWRESVPRGFLFAAKFPREITHDRALEGCEGVAGEFVRRMAGLGDTMGPLLVQLPPTFGAESLQRLMSFLDSLPAGFRYAVEVRHRSWLERDLAGMLGEREVALALVDSPHMPRMEEATAPFVYIRWLGDRREFPSGHTHARRDRAEDLTWWSARVDRFLSEGRIVFGYANNHYQNHSPSTLAQFMKVRG